MKFLLPLIIVLVFTLSCSNMLAEKSKKGVPPVVAFTNLADNQILGMKIIVQGTTDSQYGVVGVAISLNGKDYNAAEDNGWEEWSFNLQSFPLVFGSNTITATATDRQGNESATTVNFYYLEGPDLAVQSVDASSVSTDADSLQASGKVFVAVENMRGFDVPGPYDVIVFEDRDLNGAYENDNDLVLGSARITQTIAARDHLHVSIDVSGAVLFRDNRIHCFVDSRNEVMEMHEDNNVRHSLEGYLDKPSVGDYAPFLEWQWLAGTDSPESNQVMTAPVIANLDDDNDDGQIDGNDYPDIVFTSFTPGDYHANGVLRAISGDSGEEIFSVTGYRMSPGASIAAGDIDKDGMPEIVTLQEAASGINHVIAFEHDGAFKWRSDSGTALYISAMTLADVNCDDEVEIICGSIVLDGNGALLWTGTAGSGRGMSCAVDLDLDGDLEIVAGNSAYYPDGALYWQNTSVGDGFTAVADFDDDSCPEIVVVENGYVWLLEHDGQMKWGPTAIPYISTSAGGGPPVIADVDGDGQPEIGFSSADYYVVLETNGSVKWNTAMNDQTSRLVGSCAFDFEGDGSAELVCADQAYLRILNGVDGDVLLEQAVGNGTLTEIPVVADIDGDDRAEIIVAANDYFNTALENGILVFGDANDTWVASRTIWNQHAYHITNVLDDSSIPQNELNSWEHGNGYRMQFSSVKGCSDVSLSYPRVEASNDGLSADMTVRLGNGGTMKLPHPLYVSFYEGDPAAGGTLIGTEEIDQAPVSGAYLDITRQWTLPGPGQYDIYAVADDDGNGGSYIREIEENNNGIRLSVP